MEVALTSREAGLGSLRHTLAYPWKRRFTSHLSLSSEINPVSIDLFFKPKIGKYEQLNLPERYVRLLLADLGICSYCYIITIWSFSYRSLPFSTSATPFDPSHIVPSVFSRFARMLGPHLYGLGYSRQPSLQDSLAEKTFSLFLGKFKGKSLVSMELTTINGNFGETF